jgi:hypothetical protein
VTRAFKKLTDLKNAASMAIALLQNIEEDKNATEIFFLKITTNIIVKTVTTASETSLACPI